MPKKPIDWSKFCNTESSRYALQAPCRIDDKVVATDGRILIVAEAVDYPDIGPPDGRFPGIEKIIAPISGITDWHSMPEITDCELCGNTGKVTCECDVCGGYGTCTCECGHMHPCGECEGTGKVFDNKYCDLCSPRIFGLKCQRRYVEAIADLPEIQVGVSEKNPACLLFFKFDGGCGAFASIAED